MVFLILVFLISLFSHPVFATPEIKISDFSSNSDPEWIQITNMTSEVVNLVGWSLKDKANNSTSINICLSPNSSQIITNNSTWLNNTGGDTIYLYDSNQNLIDELSYTTGVDKSPPTSTNTCVVPTNTPIPTSTPTPTQTPSPTPTPDPSVTNPTSGVYLTEYMPYADPEWIEIYNSNDYPVKLVSWKIADNNGNSKSFDLSINSKNYGIYELSSLIFNNNDDEKVILLNQDGQTISESSYSKGLLTIEKSWSYISGSWCQTNITKGYENVTSCSTPTSTPTSSPSSTPSPTPTSNLGKYAPDESATASAIIDPAAESNFLSPTITPIPTTIQVLGQTDEIQDVTSKKNYLPLILIISGGLLLVSPVILNKIKLKK